MGTVYVHGEYDIGLRTGLESSPYNVDLFLLNDGNWADATLVRTLESCEDEMTAREMHYRYSNNYDGCRKIAEEFLLRNYGLSKKR